LEIDALREMDIPVRVAAESSEDVTQTPIAVAGNFLADDGIVFALGGDFFLSSALRPGCLRHK